MRESQQPNSNPSSIVTELYASLDQLTADKASSNLKTIEEAARMMTDGLADTIINGEQPGVCAPLQALRDCLYPARPKQLVFMAGRPGMGKTGMALTWALDAAKRGKRVLFVSLEMDFEELAERVLLQVTNLNSARVKSFSQFTNDPDEVITPLRNALPILGKYDMEICCPSGESCTPREISFLARMKKMRTGLDIIFVDYLGLLAPNEHRNKEYEEVTAISKQMKAVARQVDVPIICLHQLSREVESRNPRIPKLADFRSSGQIEQDAHAAILLYRPGYYHAQDGNWKENETASKHLGTTIASGDDTTTLIQIAKQRRGPTGHCFAQFDPQSTWFYDR
jgi:replicative DNA helicase